MYSLPIWLDPAPLRAREHFRAMALAYLRDEFDTADWANLPDTEWDAVLGSRLMRAHQVWGREMGLALDTRSGYYIGFMHG